MKAIKNFRIGLFLFLTGLGFLAVISSVFIQLSCNPELDDLIITLALIGIFSMITTVGIIKILQSYSESKVKNLDQKVIQEMILELIQKFPAYPDSAKLKDSIKKYGFGDMIPSTKPLKEILEKKENGE